MNRMTHEGALRHTNPHQRTIVWIALLLLIVIFGSYLRLRGLGTRSLWQDEFSTWYVSRLPLGESLHWQPELTKPPLYQVVLRMLTSESRPDEAMLRTPAVICGVLTMMAAGLLARRAAGSATGIAMVLMVACHAAQIEYSQEARPYSMFVLGCVLSTVLWYRLVSDRRMVFAAAYVTVTALSFHAHFLTALTVAGHLLWWIWMRARSGSSRRSWLPPAALGVTAVLCLPIVVHYLLVRSSLFQGLAWIRPTSSADAAQVLARLTFGWLWLALALLPAVCVWLAVALGWSGREVFQSGSNASSGIPSSNDPLNDVRTEVGGAARVSESFVWRRQPGDAMYKGSGDAVGLLIAWLGCSWFGLLVISWLVHPAMLDRYALPASIPAILIPLVVAYRVDRRAPLVLAVLFFVRAAPDWVIQASEYAPGFRELSAWLSEHVDPDTEAVVFTIGNSTYPGWEEWDRAALKYYPIEGPQMLELQLKDDGVTPKSDVLSDPQGLYMVVGWADPFKILAATGRKSGDLWVDGESYSQLLFEPFRLLYLPPLPDDPGS